MDTKENRFMNVNTYYQNPSLNWKTKAYIYNGHTSASSSIKLQKYCDCLQMHPG